MKKKIFVVAALIISSQLSAQDSARSKQMDDVVVTANKYPNKTSLTGKVLTVITREQIERSGGKDLAQLLNEQTGIYINGANSNAGKDKSIYVRGAKYDYTLICIDGVPVYDPSGVGSNFEIRLFSTANIERIEILKGSQSTLYGSDALAGVINIITRKTSNKPISSYGGFSYGSYNTLRADAGLRGQKKQISYNLSYAYTDTKGINEAADSIKNNPVKADKDGYKQHNMYASLSIQASKELSIQPYIRFTGIDGKIDQGAYSDEPDNSFTLDNLQAGLRSEWNKGKLKLTLLYNFSDIKRSFTDDSTYVQPTAYNKYSYGTFRAKEHYAEAFIHYPLSKTLKLTAGIDYRNSNTDQSSIYLSAFDPMFDYATKLSKDSAKQSQIGIYAAFNLNLTNGFNLEAGGRLNDHSEYGTNFVFNVNPSYHINEQWKLFANLSSAYKTPTLYQLYSEYGNRKLDPEAAVTVESGIQFNASNRKIMARAVYFKRHVKDVIAFVSLAAPPYGQYINQDQQNDKGVEIETEIRLIKNTSIRLSYTYVDGKITTYNGSKDTSYFNLLRRPKNSFSMNIGSRITKQLFVSVNVSAFGKRADVYFDANTYQSVPVNLRSYMLVDLYAEYGWLNNKLKLFADLRNIGNSNYQELYGYNTMGFNAYAGIRFNF